MAHAKATIGLTNYAVDMLVGHHPLISDEGAELGGKDAGPNPYELLCASLASCTAITLRMYAQRKGWDLRGATVDVRYQRHDNVSSIKRVLSFNGDLNDEQRARLADISERTPVTLTIKQGVTITTTVA